MSQLRRLCLHRLIVSFERITALPNNIPMQLMYRLDPASSTSATAVCREACPLRHESGTPYEDFLIAPTASSNGTLTITGFEITLGSHYGSAPGLHLLQLLSSGSISLSQEAQNDGYGNGLCISGPFPSYGRSSSTATPGRDLPWDPVTVTSSAVSGTQEGVLCGPVPVNTDPDDAPTMTWYPYIAQDNTKYDVYFFTPACGFDATCGQRAYVDVVTTISGSAGTETRTTTVYQEVTEDTYTLIYSGPIRPIANDDEVQVTMRLSRSRRATISPDHGNRYFLVADKIIVNASGSSSGEGSTQVKIGTGNNALSVNASTSTPVIQYSKGSGIWEYPLSGGVSSSPFLNTATSVNQIIPAVQQAHVLDRLSFGMSARADVTSATISSDGTVILAGNFTYSATSSALWNIVALPQNAQAFISANGGLNGIVTSIAVADGWIYATGAFNRTADGTVTNLQGKARWQYATSGSTWQGIAGLSSSSPATTVSIIDRTLLAFSYDRRNIDVWDPQDASIASAGSYVNGRFGTAHTSADRSSTFLAGIVYSYAQSSASSMATLTDQGIRSANLGLSRVASQGTTRRSASATSMIDDGPFARWRNRNRNKRQNASTSPTVAARSVSLNDTLADIVGAAFWYNATSKEDVTIVGGSFVAAGSAVRNIGVLTSGGVLSALPGVSDLVQVSALRIVGSRLWIAGVATSANSNNVLRVYDLEELRWTDTPISIQSDAGTAIVSSMTMLGNDVVVAGSFSSINAIDGTSNVARYIVKDDAWTALEQGLTGGVSGISATSDAIFAVGTFPQSAGATTYASVFTSSNSTWQNLPSSGLTGPGVSISADSSTNAYMAGIVSGSNATYLKRWDGRTWSDLEAPTSGLGWLDLSRSRLSQVQVVPLTDTNNNRNNAFIDNRRALLVSGQLSIANGQVASTAMYDGASWRPFLLSLAASGAPGAVLGLTYSAELIKFSQKRESHLLSATGCLISSYPQNTWLGD